MAIAAIKGQKTANELASEYEVHSSQINTWKKQALEALPEVFGQGRQRETEEQEAERDRLYQQASSVLRQSQDVRLAAPPGPGGQSQARAAADAAHGAGVGGAEA